MLVMQTILMLGTLRVTLHISGCGLGIRHGGCWNAPRTHVSLCKGGLSGIGFGELGIDPGGVGKGLRGVFETGSGFAWSRKRGRIRLGLGIELGGLGMRGASRNLTHGSTAVERGVIWSRIRLGLGIGFKRARRPNGLLRARGFRRRSDPLGACDCIECGDPWAPETSRVAAKALVSAAREPRQPCLLPVVRPKPPHLCRHACLLQLWFLGLASRNWGALGGGRHDDRLPGNLDPLPVRHQGRCGFFRCVVAIPAAHCSACNRRHNKLCEFLASSLDAEHGAGSWGWQAVARGPPNPVEFAPSSVPKSGKLIRPRSKGENHASPQVGRMLGPLVGGIGTCQPGLHQSGGASWPAHTGTNSRRFCLR